MLNANPTTKPASAVASAKYRAVTATPAAKNLHIFELEVLHRKPQHVLEVLDVILAKLLRAVLLAWLAKNNQPECIERF
jgi:hypothetical protein